MPTEAEIDGYTDAVAIAPDEWAPMPLKVPTSFWTADHRISQIVYFDTQSIVQFRHRRHALAAGNAVGRYRQFFWHPSQAIPVGENAASILLIRGMRIRMETRR